VFGWNYHPDNYGQFRETNADIPLFGSETASTVSSRGEYFFPVSAPSSRKNNKGALADFQVSSYDYHVPIWATLPDTEWRGEAKNPFVAGEFVWTGFDYLGEPTPYYGARSSYFGIIDLAGFKKDRFYLYQSRWRPDFPLAHILPHWTWPERVGQVTPVHVFTSGDEAELFLNGQSLGRKQKGAYEYRLRWDGVIYQPGTLKVVAYKNGKPWATDEEKTASEPAKLKLESDRDAIRADGKDLAFITVTVTDKNGLTAPRADNQIHFEIEGPGEIVATDNGDPTSFESFQSHDRKAFNGHCLVIVRAKTGHAGQIKLTTMAEGLKIDSAFITTTLPNK